MYIPRYRQRGGFTNNTATATVFFKNAPSQLQVTSYSTGNYEEMRDVVIKPFIPGRTISNNPMTGEVRTRNYTPATWSQTSLNPNPLNGSAVSASGQVAKYDYSAEFSSDMRNSSLFDYHRLNVLAATKAYANVKQPEVDGTVALLELRKTVEGLLNPLASVKQFLFGYRSKRRPHKNQERNAKRVAGNVRTAAKAASEQHLAIIFGIMPFVSDVNKTLKALREFNPSPERYTARGSSSDVAHQSRYLQQNEPANNNLVGGATITHTRTVTSRAYVLYEFETLLETQLGISLDEVPRALWKTLTMSFLIDWFVNVSDFVASMTPKVGVKVLAEGLSVSIIDAHLATYASTLSGTAPGGWTGYYRDLSQSLVVATKIRQPGSLAGYRGISLKQNMHKEILDTFKVTASLSLIIQKLTSFK